MPFFAYFSSLNRFRMKIKRKDLTALAGEIWSNGESYVLDGSQLLKKLQAALRECGNHAHDTTDLNFTDDELEKAKAAAENLGLKIFKDDD